MDIVVWLRSLGLGKYEAAFRDNEIEDTVLPSLTHETLKELGVAAVGHRLKLLDAIAASSAPSTRSEAELRQVTVMFSVGCFNDRTFPPPVQSIWEEEMCASWAMLPSDILHFPRGRHARSPS
jgi:hypothetical protein